jgi:predicted ATPase
MVEQVAARKAMTDETIATVIERTGGVPLFVEELTRAVLESGDAKLTGRAIPATLHDSLMARLDRLGPAKEVAQIGAVLGAEFSYELLHAVHPIAEEHLQSALRNLADAELLYVRGIAPQATYQFKHALIRDAAYEALLKSRRKDLHRRVAQTIDEKFPTLKESHPEVLARHWTEASEAELAIAEWSRAGKDAKARSAFMEALESYQKALALLDLLPQSPDCLRRELPLQLAVIPAFIAVKGWGAPEVERASTRARELCDRLGNPPELFYALGAVWGVRFIRAELKAAFEVAQQLLQRAESSQNPVHLLLAHHMMGETWFHMGELTFAREHHEIALSLDDPKRPLASGGIDEKVANLSYMSWIQWWLGYPDQALKSCNEAVESAQALLHPHSMAFAAGYASMVRGLRGELNAVQELAEHQCAISLEHGLTDFLAAARGTRGRMMVIQGHEEGILQLEHCLASGRVTGLKMVQPSWLCLLADAYIRVDRFVDGLDALTEALTIADENDDRYYEPETYRLKGELLLKQNHRNTAEAKNCFRRAVEIARNQSAKSFELRATMSLARLLREQGNANEARAMLADIYGWFTEGFDTADLKDAKALLDELSS